MIIKRFPEGKCKAVNQLRFNIAKTTAYNPTCTDVWFSEEGKIYKVPAGETIKL